MLQRWEYAISMPLGKLGRLLQLNDKWSCVLTFKNNLGLPLQMFIETSLAVFTRGQSQIISELWKGWIWLSLFSVLEHFSFYHILSPKLYLSGNIQVFLFPVNIGKHGVLLSDTFISMACLTYKERLRGLELFSLGLRKASGESCQCV